MTRPIFRSSRLPNGWPCSKRPDSSLKRVFADGFWDAPYVPVIPKGLQKLLFGSLGGLQAISGVVFLPMRWGESIMVVAQKTIVGESDPCLKNLVFLIILKSKLKFWEHGEKIHIPEEPELPEESSFGVSRPVEVQPAVLPVEQDSMAMAKPPREKPAEPNHWPWRSLLALALALLAQRSWDAGAPTGQPPLGWFFMRLPWRCWSGRLSAKNGPWRLYRRPALLLTRCRCAGFR